MLNKTLKLHEIQYGTGIEIGIRVQGNRNQSAEVNLVTVTSDKGAKTIQWRKDIFSTNDAGRTVYPHAK